MGLSRRPNPVLAANRQLDSTSPSANRCNGQAGSADFQPVEAEAIFGKPGKSSVSSPGSGSTVRRRCFGPSNQASSLPITASRNPAC